MRKRTSLAKARAQRKTTIGLALIFVLVIVFGFSLVFYFSTRSNEIDVDSAGCPKNETFRTVAFLVDATDSITPRQREDIYQGILMLASGLQQYDRLAIFSVKKTTKDVLRPDFIACRPKPSPKADYLTENLRKVKLAEERFIKEAGVVVKAAFEAAPSDASPILESIADISTQLFRYGKGDKRLILISDLLQNSNGVNHYASVPTMEQFKKLPKAGEMIPNLNGAQVCFIYLSRASANRQQNIAHKEFWRALIGLGGGSVAPCPPITEPGLYLMTIG